MKVRGKKELFPKRQTTSTVSVRLNGYTNSRTHLYIFRICVNSSVKIAGNYTAYASFNMQHYLNCMPFRTLYIPLAYYSGPLHNAMNKI